MRKRLFTLCFALTAMCASTMAQFITDENFPDANFRSFLIKNVDTNGDRWLSESETNAVTTLDVSNQGIKDLTGIEYFMKLKTLTCYGNEIKGANMSKLVNLLPFAGGRLYVCDGNVSPDNVITKAQVKKAGNKDWKVLKKEKYSTKWTSYDGENLSFTATFFPDATFRSLVAAYDTDGDNILSATELKKVFEINVAGKGITDLTGIEHFTNLTRLYCNDNGLTSLYISDNQYLEKLDCSNNELTALDVSSNKHLYLLRCFGNNISGTAMSILISGLSLSLAEIGEWGRLVVCCDQSTHDNTITTADIKDAMSRDWEVWQEEEGGLHFTAMLVKIDNQNFPDANFRAIVAGEGIDTDRDSYLSIAERKAVGKLDLYKKSISNLTGIEYFTELRKLYCSSNNLTTLNVTYNKKLEILYCDYNNLTSLDVSKNTALTYLGCYNNSLESLNVLKNTALTELHCSWNSLQSLDVSNNTALTYLDCLCNNLKFLDVSNNTALEELLCSSNSLKSLDVSKNKALATLLCYRNQIKGAAMDNLVNGLPNTGGTLYVCDKYAETDNVITASQVRVATGKGWMVKRDEGGGNNYVDYPGVFEPVAIDATNFPDEKFRNYLLAQDYGQDAVLTEDEMLAVTELKVSGKGIKDLTGIEYFRALTKLDCSSNSLKSLDTSQNTALEKLSCGSNSLTKLEISKNTALNELECSNNGLTSIDVSHNTALAILFCMNNGLTSLDISQNRALTWLACSGNQIRGAEMDNLANGLSEMEETIYGLLYICDDRVALDNIITPAQVKTATDKGWQVQQHYNKNWVDYAGEEPGITIDATNFPDDNFRNYLLKWTDFGQDGFLTEKEIKGITELNVVQSEIADLTGIAFFTELESLNCHSCELTSLDLSNNTKLKTLECSINNLESLNVSNCTALTKLECGSNNLTSLDVSNCLLLESLYCPNNSLTSLVVSNISLLKELICLGNQISGTAMTKLVNNLPNTNGTLIVCYDYCTPDNVITAAQVKVAKGKGWMVKKCVEPGGNETVNYAGQGDANGDNKIDKNDLDAIEQIIMGKNPVGVGGYAGDLNNDGKVDAADIVVMINILNGK